MLVHAHLLTGLKQIQYHLICSDYHIRKGEIAKAAEESRTGSQMAQRQECNERALSLEGEGGEHQTIGM